VAKEKKIQLNSFEAGVDADSAEFGKKGIQPSFARFLLNCRLFEDGYNGIIKLVKGNTQVTNSYLPAGNNLALGWGSNEERSKFYWFNWNSNGYHGCYCYNDLDQSVTPVIQNILDTDGVDIFHFDPGYLINHVDIIADNLIYWVDGLNKARKFNITKAIDKTSTGYGPIISEDFITAYKQTSIYAPVPVYFTDVNRSSNYLYALQFKFAQRFYYDDGEVSNTSDFSDVALPPNESFLGADNITYSNNCIQVQIATGNRLVTKVEVLVQMTNGEVILPWQSAIILNKSQLNIADNTNFVYYFYNDNPLTAVDNNKVVRPYSFMQRVPYVQSFVKLAMTYGNAFEGFPTVNVSASVAVTSQNLFLPNDTVTQLNSPAFTVSLTSKTKKHGGFLAHDSYWVTQTHFIVGHDVKKGNTFVMTGKNGATSQQQRLNPTYDNYNWSVTAVINDTPDTIASQLKQFLRSTGRGQTPTLNADPNGGIFNESTDGSGNVSWDYWYLGHDNTQPTIFSGYVNPVNYVTLLDNGPSVNVIKSGGSRKYAIVYEDDDGRKSLAYTDDALLAKTPFLTQWGTSTLQQPIHTITITSLPPVWAKYWQLVRTKDITDFTQMLIQQVVEVDVADEGNYLDLVVGSLNTYQLIHPNTVIQYQFQKGDRVRFIKSEVPTPTLYTPYFETEVLSYKDVVTQIINANIACTNGSNNVTPSDGVKADYVGKYIIINDVQRLIVSISGGAYVLNEPFNPVKTYTTDAVTTATFPTYTLLDTRGIIRINKPPSGITFVAYSTVEVYHPQVTVNNDGNLEQAQNFQDFSMKFPVLNYGTAQAAHVGNIKNSSGTPNQDPNNPSSVPAIVQVMQGDCYVRQRALPVNNPQNPQDAQVIVDTVEDPNFSDFYLSNLYSLGRVFPQDDGRGSQNFNQRERFSNNYIQGTAVNGLNDFDAQDYKDYNDNYGSIMLTRYRQSYLYMFKVLKITWTPISQNIIVDNQGQQQLATSDQLLNTLQYSVWEGGIGKRGAWFEFGDYQYITSDNSGVILRGAQNGWEPISKKFLYDKVTKDFLSVASINNLQITGQYDKLNDEAMFSYMPFIKYLFNGGFNPVQWQTLIAQYPVGTTWVITQQPANSSAAVVSGIIQITGTNTLGDDYLLFQGNLPGGGTTPVIKFCFTVTNAPYRATGWQPDNSTVFCLQSGGVNTGQEIVKILDQIYLDNSALTGMKMPNLQMIAPEAIVPSSATITYNPNTSPTPSGGSNGDIWYNAPVDNLYKNISGTWTLLTDRVTNQYYAPSVQNLTDCPVPPPSNFYTLYARYGMNITAIADNTCTGTPAFTGKLPVNNGNQVQDAYTTITAGTVNVNVTGTPVIPNHVQIYLSVNGVTVDQQTIISGTFLYSLNFPSNVSSPTPIVISFQTF
jgi:hypothetical protein